MLHYKSSWCDLQINHLLKKMENHQKGRTSWSFLLPDSSSFYFNGIQEQIKCSTEVGEVRAHCNTGQNF